MSDGTRYPFLTLFPNPTTTFTCAETCERHTGSHPEYPKLHIKKLPIAYTVYTLECENQKRLLSCCPEHPRRRIPLLPLRRPVTYLQTTIRNAHLFAIESCPSRVLFFINERENQKWPHILLPRTSTVSNTTFTSAETCNLPTDHHPECTSLCNRKLPIARSILHKWTWKL